MFYIECNFNDYVGIGFIRKIEKTKIKWLKDELFKDEFEEPNDDELISKQKTNQLIKESEKISKEIITFKDLKCLCDDDQKNLLAIHAPVGTSMEIPDPESCVLVYKKTLDVNNPLFNPLTESYLLFLTYIYF